MDLANTGARTSTPAPANRLPASDRGVYGITVAAELSGAPLQSLRLWERHGLLSPARTDGGTRRYSAAAWSALRVLLRGRPAVEHYRAQPGVVPDHLPLSGDPGFDVAAWVAADFQPLPGHLL